MKVVEKLESVINDIEDVYLSNTVYKELSINTPSVTLWIYDNILNITSTLEYNGANDSINNIDKICDICDLDIIMSIYKSTIEYNTKDLRIKNLIGIFSRISVI